MDTTKPRLGGATTERHSDYSEDDDDDAFLKDQPALNTKPGWCNRCGKDVAVGEGFLVTKIVDAGPRWQRRYFPRAHPVHKACYGQR